MQWIDLGKYIQILTDFDPCSSRRVNKLSQVVVQCINLDSKRVSMYVHVYSHAVMPTLPLLYL